jgi:hypothetical protein
MLVTVLFEFCGVLCLFEITIQLRFMTLLRLRLIQVFKSDASLRANVQRINVGNDQDRMHNLVNIQLLNDCSQNDHLYIYNNINLSRYSSTKGSE